MYRILLVDDEWFVLEGMKKLLEEVRPDLEIVLAQSGRQALDHLEKQTADIVFTDIRMPGMSGIELIDKLTKRSQGCKIIILSGHQDFEYAQYAIKHNVRDYLLKPVTRTLLTLALEKVLDELERERHRDQRLAHLERQLEESLPILRERFFFELAHGAYNSGLAGLFAAPPQPYMRLITHSIDRAPGGREDEDGRTLQLQLLELRHLLEQHLSQEFTFHPFADGERLSLVLYLSPSQNVFYLERTWRDFQRQVEREAGFSFSGGVSKAFSDYRRLHVAAQQAAAAIGNKLYSGAGTLMFYDNLQDREEAASLTPDIAQLKRRLSDSLGFEDFEAAAGCLERIREGLKERACSESHVRAVAFDLFSTLSLYAFEKSVDLDSPAQGRDPPLHSLLRADTIDHIFLILHEQLERIVDQVRQRSSNRMARIVQAIKKHTAEHLGSDLSLEVLSGVVYLTPNYIGLIFRKETGMSYKDYLTAQRMERAKELLRAGNLKIYEVAEQVGYKSVTYFSKIFKSNTGVYPSEYK